MRQSFLWHCLIFIPLFFFLVWPVAASHSQQKKGGPTSKEIQEVIDLIEDPQKREAFLKDLRKVLRAKEAVKESTQEKAPVPPEKKAKMEGGLYKWFGSLESLRADVAGWVDSVPRAVAKQVSLLAQPGNRIILLRLLVDVGGSLLLALILGLGLRRIVLKRTAEKEGLYSPIGFSVMRVAFYLLPYGLILAFLFLSFSLFPTFPLAQSFCLFLFAVVFFYKLTVEVFRLFLLPEEDTMRIFHLDREHATFLWTWIVRVFRYTAFYLVAVRGIRLIELPPDFFSLIRGVLLLVFPVMLTGFIVGVSRRIRAKHAASGKAKKKPPGTSKRISEVLLRYWTVPAVGCVWMIFLFFAFGYHLGLRYLLSATLWTILTVICLALTLKLLEWLYGKLFVVNEKMGERFPGIEVKTHRYTRVLKSGLGYVVWISALGIIADLWGLPVSEFVASETGSSVILSTLTIALTAGAAIVIIELTRFLRDSLLEEREEEKGPPTQKKKTLVPLITTAVKIAVGFVAGVVILEQVGVDTTPILAGAGIVGLAVGFGAQTLVKDIINGLFIIFEESIAVGDVAAIGGKSGIVEAVSLRTVRLRDLSGNLHVIPNSSIDTLTNMTKEYSRYVFDVGVAYKEDADKVTEVLKEIGEEMQNDPDYGPDILEPLEILGVDRFDDSAVVIKARVTTKPIRQWSVGREFNRRIKKAFDEQGIEIPFPHRTIFMREPKQVSGTGRNLWDKAEEETS